MNKFNRILSLLLAAVLVFSLLPAQAHAVPAQPENQSAELAVKVNPLYSHVFTTEEMSGLLKKPDPAQLRPQGSQAMELEAAAQVVRDGMKARQEIVEIDFLSTQTTIQSASDELWSLVMAHTGVPSEGDALLYQYGGMGGSFGKVKVADGLYRYTGYYSLLYYTTYEQEQELDRAVEELLVQLDLDGKTDYEKIRGVYDYICANITYDYEHLQDPDYYIMYTAYGALVNKTSVCQGYAVLLYRLLLELGVDCRVIAGWGGGPHAWNIVELDGLYYNADSTWDAGYPSYYWYYFLNSMWDFLDHMRNEEYNTVAFHNAYPMAAQSYQQGAKAEMDPYIDAGYLNDSGTAFWRVRRSGDVMEIFGTGDCWDYPEEENQVPWYYAWFDTVTDLRVDEGISRLGNYAFRDAAALETVKLPTTLESLGTNCFQRCENLSAITFTGDAPTIASNAFTGVTATAYYPGDNATWTADKLQNYGGTLTWKIDGATHSHSYTAAVTAPTCTEQGFTTYTCECGEGYIADYVPALGHAWDEGVVTIEPTEETYGEMRYTCTACGATRTEPIPPVVHSHNYTAVVTAPTCTNSGFTTYTCACGDSYTAEYIPALGHALGEWYTVTAPTCTAYGTDRRDCSRCSHYEVRFTEKLDHSYTAVVTAPTCTTEGYTTYTCACGDSYVSDYTEALGHDLGAWYTVTAPTCTESGSERRDCARCDHHETRVTEARGHDHKATVTAPTCTDQGYTTYICACGDSYISDYTEALGHALGEWHIVTEATCTESGLEERNCSRCDYTETRPTEKLDHSYTAVVTDPTCTEQGYTTYTCSCGKQYVDNYTNALGHSWDDGVVTKEPTEEEYGEKLHTCTRCGETKTEKLPPLDHTHSYAAVVTAPTCTAQGYTTYICSCGDSYVADYTEPLGHDLGEWYTVTAPTCTAYGTERRDCSRCSHYEVRFTEKLDHSYAAVVTAPTCTEQGYTTYICSCGDSYVSDYTDALGHVFEDGICSVCGAGNNPFADVPDDPGCYYRDPVIWAVEKGITDGVDDTHFAPENFCTRGQVVTFLWRAAGCPEPTRTDNPFEDVKEGEYYYTAVLWAVEKGITDGVDDTHFAPETDCSRAQVVTFLYRAMGSDQIDTGDCPFTDVESGKWYEIPVLWAVVNGITDGVEDGLFGTEIICSRGQTVTFLYRTYVN